MARLRHASFVRTEHAAIGVGAVVTVAGVMLLPVSGGAQAAGTQEAQAVVPPTVAPVPDLATQLRSLSPASVATPSTAAANTAFAGAAMVVPTKPIKKPNPTITPSGWFTPVTQYYFSATFGEPGPWQSGYHTGLDFVTDEGRKIRAAHAGIVIGAEEEGAYGNLVRIKIGRDMEIWMAHMNDFEVTKGERVTAGQVVGHVGMTGHTTGPHVHFEVRVKDEPRDPAKYFWPNGPAQELR